MGATTTFLVTGASSGIGLELVKQIATASENNQVIATVRQRKSSQTGVDEISKLASAQNNITILEGIDVSNDSVGEILIRQLKGPIDVVIHNAGSLSGTREKASNVMAEQNFDSITMERMRAAFEVNTLGPLKVQKTLMQNNFMNTTGGGKVAIISTGLASIEDNKSGGNYAYRASKAALNMIARCMSCDLKDTQISVLAIAPGFVSTEFGPGKETMEKWGAMPVETSCKGILDLVENTMNLKNTGKFFCVNRDGSSREFPW